jgi:hypothetical protein
MLHDELKRVSLAAMEEAIGTALSKLAGLRYTCDISQLDLTGTHAKLTISLEPPNFFDHVANANVGANEPA